MFHICCPCFTYVVHASHMLCHASHKNMLCFRSRTTYLWYIATFPTLEEAKKNLCYFDGTSCKESVIFTNEKNRNS